MSNLTLPQPKSQRQLPWHRVFPMFGLLLAAAIWCERTPSTGLRLYKERLDSQFVLGQDEFGKREARLYQNGMLSVSEKSFIPRNLESEAPTAIHLFGGPLNVPHKIELHEKKGAPSRQLLKAPLPLSEASPIQISIVADSQELFDPATGILSNFTRRGRDWERRAWLTARDHTGVFFENPIGLRIHGGQSRKEGIKSLGLYFRKSYQGSAGSPKDIFFGSGSRSAEKIAVINASKSTRFMGAMVTEMAAIAGCKTSRVRPAKVYLNGQIIKSPYFLFEHQTEEFLKDYYDCEVPVIHRLKGDNPKIPFYTEWRNEVRRSDKKWDMKRLHRFFDIDDICAWAFIITYTVTLDNNQGIYYYDASKPDDVWKCLTWDMDGCFNRVFSGQGSSKPTYVTDPFTVLSPLRGTMFMRLVEDSEEFYEYYEKFCAKVLNQHLTKEVIMKLHDKYTALAKEYEFKPHDLDWTLAETRKFLETRHEFYFEYLKQQRAKYHPNK